MDVRDPYAPPRRGWIGPLLGLGVAFAAGIALAGYAVAHWQPLARWLRPEAPVQAVAVLPAKPALPTPSTRPLVIAPALPDQALATRIDTVVARMDAIDLRAKQASGDANRAEGLLVAFAVRRALDRGAPLGFLEGMLRQRFGGIDAQAVATIVSASQRPVTLAQLQERFDQIGPALAGPPPQQGWWQGLRREVGGLFVVRRAETVSTRPTDRLARAGRALDGGQVDLAMTEISRLPAAPAAADWTAAARRYVLARNALDRIETAALLAPPPAPVATVATVGPAVP